MNGIPLYNWQQSFDLANNAGKRLLLKEEVSYIMNSLTLPNTVDEFWVAVGDHANKDFVQVGTSPNVISDNQNCKCSTYPETNRGNKIGYYSNLSIAQC